MMMTVNILDLMMDATNLLAQFDMAISIHAKKRNGLSK
jgi:hypothetical protein